MSISRKWKVIWISISGVVVGLGLVVWIMLPAVERWAAGCHQRAVTRQVEEWGREYSAVTNETSAIAAAEMVDYMSHFYIPGPGYHGPADVEEALETQRRDNITLIVEALERYIGLGYGTNVKRWGEWARERRATITAKPDSSTTCTSQPKEANTNRTSAAGP